MATKTKQNSGSAHGQRLLKSVVVKSEDTTLTGNRLECVPSVMGNLDSYADVIFPPKKAGKRGPFAAAIPDFLRRGFNTTDHEWKWDELVAYPISAEERGNKLVSVIEFHSDQRSQDMLTKCRERLAANKEVGLSIGFTVLPEDVVYFPNGRALLEYAKNGGWDLALFDVADISAYNGPCQAILRIYELWEFSLTPCPANRQAIAVAIKSFNANTGRADQRVSLSARKDIRMTNTVNKNICGSLSLELGPRDMKWSAAEAAKRVKAFCAANEEPNGQLAKAFVLMDGPADEFDSYRFPFVDVKDGKLVAVYSALKGIADTLGGSRGGAELSEQDRESAMRFVEGYFTKAAQQYDDDEIAVPWAHEAANGGETAKWKGQYLGNYIEMDMCTAAMYEAFIALYYEIGDCMVGYGQYSDMGESERLVALQGMHDEFTNLCMAMYKSIMSGKAEQDAETAAKSIKAIVLPLIGSLGDGVSYTKSAQIAVDATKALIERTELRAAMRQKDNRGLSVANWNTLKEHRDKLKASVDAIDGLIAEHKPKSVDEAALAQRRTELRKRFLKNMVASIDNAA